MAHEGLYSAGGNQEMTQLTREQHETQVTNEYRHLYEGIDISKAISIICDDDRLKEPGLRQFGGGPNLPYMMAVVQEEAEPGSFNSPMKAFVLSLVPTFRQRGVIFVVHSDRANEPGDSIDIAIESGDIGCKWLDKLADISSLTAKEPELVIARAQLIRPESFAEKEDYDMADSLVDATGRLVSRPSVFGGYNGREIAVGSIKQNAIGIVAEGLHNPKSKAFYNMMEGTRFNAKRAIAEDMPAYDQDAWSIDEIIGRVAHLFPYDSKKVQMANLINFSATTIALGLEAEDVMAMRPEELLAA